MSLRSGQFCVGSTIRSGPLALTGIRASRHKRDDLNKEFLTNTITECLTNAGLRNQVRHRLGRYGALSGWVLSGGVCIARSLATRPRVLLIDLASSALDPTQPDYVNGRFD